MQNYMYCTRCTPELDHWQTRHGEERADFNRSFINANAMAKKKAEPQNKRRSVNDVAAASASRRRPRPPARVVGRREGRKEGGL